MRAVIDAVANATSTKEQIFKLIHEFNGANVSTNLCCSVLNIVNLGLQHNINL